ncbi:hypothetical protein, conserved [Plasmodium gonderi]|uniref:Uncharacterized protein n=1 Tax=Plasmodium gonderi TaxID=77519 RepID=A0A1Y1JEW9_PLAGO|nr:hypothetical protein, conserved [Plasmodium gonderi]GAW79282.1 hypothetical protein, conserved [Plasmodium gonderi]
MVRRNVSENEVIKKIDAINLKEAKGASVSMNNYTNLMTHKLRKNREGIIWCIERIGNLEGLTRKMNKELANGNKELKKLTKNIIKFDMLNSQLENSIISEMNKDNAYKTRISILKKKQVGIKKAQGIINSDINYMETRINMMKEQVDENVKKYYKLVSAKDKMHNEMIKFKKDRKILQQHLKNTKKNHQILKNQMQNFVQNMNQ